MVKRSDLGLLLLRLSVGGTLVAHGAPKLFGGEDRQPPQLMAQVLGSNYPKAWAGGGPKHFAEVLQHLGVPWPETAAQVSGWAEFGGGLALGLGLATPLTATAILGNMLVAIYKAHWKTGFYGQGGYEHALALAAGAAALLGTGPGALSVDAVLR